MFDSSRIIPIIINLVQIFLQFSIITSLLKRQVYWGITLASSVVIALLYFENPWIMLGVFYVSTAVYYILIAKMRLKQAILAIAMNLFLPVLISNIIDIIYHGLLPTIHVSFMHLTSMLILVALLIAIRHYKFDIAHLTRKKTIFALSSLMMITALIAWTNNLHFSASDEFTRSAQLYNALWMFTMQSAVIYIVVMLNKLAVEIEHHEFHRLYTDTLEDSLDNLKMFKHGYRDMINTLLAMCGLKRFDQIEDYLRKRTNDIRHDINISRINNRLKDNMPYLYGIFLAKAILAESTKVRFNMDIMARSFELKTVSGEQLSRMVGNLLSNAFEAALQSDEKSVTVRITNHEDNRIKIEIINSIDSLVDTSNLTKKRFSTKEGHTGYGLYEVQSIIDRQKKEGMKIEFNLRSSDNTFIAELIV